MHLDQHTTIVFYAKLKKIYLYLILFVRSEPSNSGQCQGRTRPQVQRRAHAVQRHAHNTGGLQAPADGPGPLQGQTLFGDPISSGDAGGGDHLTTSHRVRRFPSLFPGARKRSPCTAWWRLALPSRTLPQCLSRSQATVSLRRRSRGSSTADSGSCSRGRRSWPILWRTAARWMRSERC